MSLTIRTRIGWLEREKTKMYTLSVDELRHRELANGGKQGEKAYHASTTMPSAQTETEPIKVFARFRPLTRREVEAGHEVAWCIQGKNHINRVDLEADTADFSMWPRMESPERIFCAKALQGRNGCVIAYGQTQAGKTHTVMGTPQDPGMILHAVVDVLALINGYNSRAAAHARASRAKQPVPAGGSKFEIADRHFLVRCSYVEVYMERVRDLFNPSTQSQPDWGSQPFAVRGDPPRDGPDWLPIRESATRGGFFVEGLRELVVDSEASVVEAVARANCLRRHARTCSREISSRSHTVFCISIESANPVRGPDGKVVAFKAVREGRLFICDLAGSENIHTAFERSRLSEGKTVCRSLFFLSEVIAKLGSTRDPSPLRSRPASQSPPKRRPEIDPLLLPAPSVIQPNFRVSALTKLLAPSLSTGRISVIVNIHPSHAFTDFSVQSLRFAEKTSSSRCHSAALMDLDPHASVLCASSGAPRGNTSAPGVKAKVTIAGPFARAAQQMAASGVLRAGTFSGPLEVAPGGNPGESRVGRIKTILQNSGLFHKEKSKGIQGTPPIRKAQTPPRMRDTTLSPSPPFRPPMRKQRPCPPRSTTPPSALLNRTSKRIADRGVALMPCNRAQSKTFADERQQRARGGTNDDGRTLTPYARRFPKTPTDDFIVMDTPAVQSTTVASPPDNVVHVPLTHRSERQQTPEFHRDFTVPSPLPGSPPRTRTPSPTITRVVETRPPVPIARIVTSSAPPATYQASSWAFPGGRAIQAPYRTTLTPPARVLYPGPTTHHFTAAPTVPQVVRSVSVPAISDATAAPPRVVRFQAPSIGPGTGVTPVVHPLVPQVPTKVSIPPTLSPPPVYTRVQQPNATTYAFMPQQHHIGNYKLAAATPPRYATTPVLAPSQPRQHYVSSFTTPPRYALYPTAHRHPLALHVPPQFPATTHQRFPYPAYSYARTTTVGAPVPAATVAAAVPITNAFTVTEPAPQPFTNIPSVTADSAVHVPACSHLHHGRDSTDALVPPELFSRAEAIPRGPECKPNEWPIEFESVGSKSVGTKSCGTKSIGTKHSSEKQPRNRRGRPAPNPAFLANALKAAECEPICTQAQAPISATVRTNSPNPHNVDLTVEIKDFPEIIDTAGNRGGGVAVHVRSEHGDSPPRASVRSLTQDDEAEIPLAPDSQGNWGASNVRVSQSHQTTSGGANSYQHRVEASVPASLWNRQQQDSAAAASASLGVPQGVPDGCAQMPQIEVDICLSPGSEGDAPAANVHEFHHVDSSSPGPIPFVPQKRTPGISPQPGVLARQQQQVAVSRGGTPSRGGGVALQQSPPQRGGRFPPSRTAQPGQPHSAESITSLLATINHINQSNHLLLKELDRISKIVHQGSRSPSPVRPVQALADRAQERSSGTKTNVRRVPGSSLGPVGRSPSPIRGEARAAAPGTQELRETKTQLVRELENLRREQSKNDSLAQQLRGTLGKPGT
uniref:Kinesin motor domain-containing protein n=1 Tax=Chromera velia CCMP2878 TaxID=1169474 RepID=A0A0G4GMB5_9ALVE|eukprot:Cvel_4911.t1-p1 / transcript=Cvel_4911.t1 / gene=Cvel_4911 / organism=Chromera_velia_CCMP2878 / gene_product=Kinesin heavy chain, putative / transcript_product=Kinesin heavy chain, putative / location=Cvel_scaffold221:77591-87671(-) / protein_length=1467 / sequence_SO=supercontig / SO=protein_coding / is_pseudo=false